MDIRRYLTLESSLCAKMRQAWTKQAIDIYSRMDDLIKQGKTDEAYRLRAEIDLGALGEAYRGWIKAVLRSTAMFGALQVTDKPALKVSNDWLDRVAGNFIDYLREVTPGLQDDLAQSIARLQVQKADTLNKPKPPRFVKDFVSFRDKGDTKLQMISSLHTSRLAAWGFLMEAQLQDVTTYRLRAVLDARTSPFCQWIDGKTFSVEEGYNFIENVLAVKDPNDLAQMHPWPDQSQAGMASIEHMDSAELTARGYFVPPFHPNCRTILVMANDNRTLNPSS